MKGGMIVNSQGNVIKIAFSVDTMRTNAACGRRGGENVTFLEGTAKFVSSHEVAVNGETIHGAKFIIATGSTASVPPIEGTRDAGFVAHIEALKLKKPPKYLIIVGAPQGPFVPLDSDPRYIDYTFIHGLSPLSEGSCMFRAVRS